MPLWSGKLVEIDLVLGHLVLENRAAFDLLNRYGFVRGEFFSPGVKIIYAAQVGRDSHRRTGALAGAKDVRDDSEFAREAVKLAEQQRWPLFFRCPLGQRSNLQVEIDALKST